MANNFFYFVNFNCTSGDDVHKPRSTILKRGRTIIKKRFEPKKSIVKSDLPRTKGILKNQVPRIKSILKNRVNNEQGNSVWFDLSEPVDFSFKSISKDIVDPKHSISRESESTDFSISNDSINKTPSITSHSSKEESVPMIIDSTPKHGTDQVDAVNNSVNLNSTSDETLNKRSNSNSQSPKEKRVPKIIDSTLKNHNGQTDKSSINNSSTPNSKYHVSKEETYKPTNSNFKEIKQNDLSEKITGIQSAGRDVYSINVSNSRFFVPNNYVYTNYDNSMDDLSFKVDPEITKALRKSLEEKARSTTDITETLKKSVANENLSKYDKKFHKSTDIPNTKVEPKVVQEVRKKNFQNEDNQNKEFCTVTLRKPLLSELVVKDIPLEDKAADSSYVSKVELRRPLKNESLTKDTTSSGIKRPLTENLQLSRSNFLRNSIHETQSTSLSFKRY